MPRSQVHTIRRSGHIHKRDAQCQNGVDLDLFEDKFTNLLENLSKDSRKIVVSGLLPRKTVDLEPYNDRLRSLCDTLNVEFIDHYEGFLLATGEDT